MPASYDNTTKAARLQAVANAIDSGPAAGYLEIGTANMATVLVTIHLNDPCGVVSANELVFSGFPKQATVGTNGEAVAAVIKDSNGVVRVGAVTPLTVGTTVANDIQIASKDLVSGNVVIVNSLRIISP